MSDEDKPIRVQVNTILEKMIAKPDNQPTAWIEMLDDMEALIATAVREARIDELESNRNLTGLDVGWIHMTKDDVDERLVELKEGDTK